LRAGPYGGYYTPAYALPPVYTQPQYWYYRPNPQGYYAYIASCANSWLRVVPRGTTR
jgi:hypothetical protein